MINYNLKRNRREAFIKWFAASELAHDLDPAIWMTNYLHERFQHNSEQRLWFAWLYGNTYHLPTAWLLFQEFPDFENATVDRITRWNSENYKRLRYQTDTKWNKGHLPTMFASYKATIGDSLQMDRLTSFYDPIHECNSFNNLWDFVNANYFKFGRYSTWFYLQHLKHTANIKIEASCLMLSDYSGSRSHRNGLLYALGMEQLIDTKLSSCVYEKLEHEANEILIETQQRFPKLMNQLDFFSQETALCSFKKMFRTDHSRYIGYYLDRQAEEIMRVEKDGWYGIDWNVLHQAREETLDPRLNKWSGIDKSKFGQLLSTGTIEKFDWYFEDNENIGLEAFA